MATYLHFHQTVQNVINCCKESAPEIAPCVDNAADYDDTNEREERDLAAGLVLKAVLEEGTDCRKGSPSTGDLVLVHFICRLSGQTVPVASSLQQHGGRGEPVAFLCGGGGRRAPRAWELTVQQMARGELCLLKVDPKYAYEHPDCGMRRPEGVGPSDHLEFELRLLQFYPAAECSAVPLELGGKHGEIFKRVVQEGVGWETPRAPFEVELTCTVRALPDDGDLQSGRVLFSTGVESPVTICVGANQVERHFEAAVCSMLCGERAVFVSPAGGLDEGCGLVIPTFAAERRTVEYDVAVSRIIQVRDMTGTGEVTKRRLREGEGEFPIDCPLEDCKVLIHYKVTQNCQVVYDSRGENGAGQPVEFTLGNGEFPPGLEMAVRLMTVKEVARVDSVPDFAYSAHGLCEQAELAGFVQPTQPVEWEIELVDFEKAPNWHQMSCSERFKVAEEIKESANKLFAAKRYQHAKTKYEKAYKVVNHTFDIEDDEQQGKLGKLKTALELNIAAVWHKVEYSLLPFVPIQRLMMSDRSYLYVLGRRIF